MPKRIIDGEGIWLSKKIYGLKPEYRLHYANLLPLAESDGSFEYDPTLIRVRVYSLLMPDITEDFISEMFADMERVGLVRFFERDGKTFAYLNGIEKAGRLPEWGGRPRFYSSNAERQKAYRERLKTVAKEVGEVKEDEVTKKDVTLQNVTLHSTYTNTIPRTVPFPLPKPEPSGGIRNVTQDPLPEETGPVRFADEQGNWKHIASHFSSHFGFIPASREADKQDYQRVCAEYGEEVVLAKFNEWAPNNEWVREKRARFGLRAFYEDLPVLLAGEELARRREELAQQREKEKAEFLQPTAAPDFSEVDAAIQREIEARKAELAAEQEQIEKYRGVL